MATSAIGSAPVPAVLTTVTSTDLKRRSIGFWEAFGMSLAALGPVLGMLTVAPVIVGQSGYATPFVILLSGVAIFMVAYAIAEFSKALPSAGSIYTYISHGLGGNAAFLVAWVSFLYYSLFEPQLLLAFGTYGHDGMKAIFGIDLPWFVWATLAAAIAFALSYIGIGLSLRIGLLMSLFENVVLLVAAAFIVFKGGAHGNSLAPFLPSSAPSGVSSIALGMTVGVVVFLGFEQSFTLSEEVTDKKRDVPRAIYLSLLLMWGLFLFCSYALVNGFGANHMSALTSDPTPWYTLTRRFWNGGGLLVLQFVAMTSILANTIASHNAVVRIFYGMGRDGALPRLLGQTHLRFRTPHVAIIGQSALSLVITLVAGSAFGVLSAFNFISFTNGFAAVVAFIAIEIAAFVFFLKAGRDRSSRTKLALFALPVVATLILFLPLSSNFYPAPPAPLNLVPYLVVVWVLLGAGYLIYQRQRGTVLSTDTSFHEIAEMA